MAVPAQKNLTFYQGDTWILQFRLKDSTGHYIDLTGATPTAQVRQTQASSSVSATWTCTLDNQTTNAGGVTMVLASGTTTALTGTYVYDVQLTYSDATVKTYLYGNITVINEVTHS